VKRKRPLCKHCHKREAAKRSRGLCGTCHKDREIRALYPTAYVYSERAANLSTHREPTEAELDAIIAEQSQHLPDWWDTEDPRT
jgi:hypothetical protein